MHRRVFIVGGHTTPFLGKGSPNFIWKKHPDFGKKENPSLKDYIVSAVNGALTSTKIAPALINRCYVGNFAGELYNQQGHLGAAMAGAHKDLMYKPSMRVEGACASGGLAASAAIDALRAGKDDLALVVGTRELLSCKSRWVRFCAGLHQPVPRLRRMILVAGAEQQTTASARDGGMHFACWEPDRHSCPADTVRLRGSLT
jgi:acetyl-CoA acetyltransferase